MTNINIAVLTASQRISFSETAIATAAIMRQVNDHLAQYWNVRANVSAFASHEDVPLGYWRVTVVDGRPYGRLGVHRDIDGQPFAKVSSETGWTVALSHEILEMLVDPTLSQFKAGYLYDGRRVNFLLEICDPCQSKAYTVNGTAVSDFITPAFFEPGILEGARYSFNGSIKRPRTVAPYGYLAWCDPTDGNYYALTSDGRRSRTMTLGAFPGGFSAPREWVDSLLRRAPLRLPRTTLSALAKAGNAHKSASAEQARRWVGSQTSSLTARRPKASRHK